MPKVLPEDLRNAIIQTLTESPEIPLRAVGRRYKIAHSTITRIWQQIYFEGVAKSRSKYQPVVVEAKDRSQDIIRRARIKAASRKGPIDDGDAKDLTLNIVDPTEVRRYLEVRRRYEQAVVCSDIEGS